MSRIIKHFSKHCSCHLQGECVVVGHFWKPHTGQVVGGELDLMVLIGGMEEQDSSPLFHSTSLQHQIQLATHCLPCIRLPKVSSHYTFTLKMTVAVFAETLDNFQHLTCSSPEAKVTY
jgi:hypothetical protein